MTFDQAFLDSYRFFREHGSDAQTAVTQASRERRLSRLVDAGILRVRWERDSEPYKTNVELLRRRIESGRCEVLGVIIERRHECLSCGVATWEAIDSCWGIVLDVNEGGVVRRRWMEAEVFSE